MLTITNEDNMALMARYPNNYFELAIVDPPYGINADKNAHKNGIKCKANGFREYKESNWDNEIPKSDYWNELFRVSKNQIVWGGNYFVLPPTPCWLIWDKGQRDFSFADAELAWTSFNTAVRIKTIHRSTANFNEQRLHPTQKPSLLYKWILDKYAKQGDKILDTHLGSGSIAIACHDYGFDLTACELDKEYFEKAMERINNHVAQQKLF
jgi:site-specific DNA-methyltransferase (adenine-specific)